MQVVLYNPKVPDEYGVGWYMNVHPCCWGPGNARVFPSSLFNIGYGYRERGCEVFYTEDMPQSADVIVMPITLHRRRWYVDEALKLRSRIRGCRIEAMECPSGMGDDDSLISNGVFDGFHRWEAFRRVAFDILPDLTFDPWIFVFDGCPHSCVFCCWRRVRNRLDYLGHSMDVGDLIRLAERLAGGSRQMPYLMCSDITEDRGWFERFKEGWPRWPYITDVRATNVEKFEELAETGCRSVTMGLEAADDDVLAEIRKGFTTSDWLKAHDKLVSLGIRVSVPILFGLSDREDPEKYARFVSENGLREDRMHCGIAKMYPGSPWYGQSFEWYVEYGDPLKVRVGVALAVEKMRRFKELVKCKSA